LFFLKGASSVSDEMIIEFEKIGMHDVSRVGGKNASLGEMITALSGAGIEVPTGFATSVSAFQRFLEHDGLGDKIQDLLKDLDTNDLSALSNTGKTIRDLIENTPFPAAFVEAIKLAYDKLKMHLGVEELAVAVRSSATAEDLPDASFAGQQESFLNVRDIENVLIAIKKVFASLYNDRAIAYRVHQNFHHADVGISAGIQQMARSDKGASGVMFTLDTESGFEDVVFITASYGLGETVVQGQVNPDEFYVYKPALLAGKDAIIRRHCGSKLEKMIYDEDSAKNNPVGQCNHVKVIPVSEAQQRQFCLSDAEILKLSEYAITIEKHYKRPMDIEWAKDGLDGKLYILQARPETVKSHKNAGQTTKRFKLLEKGEVLITGRSIGQKIGSGTAKVLANIQEIHRIQPGDVLVTDITDPDWEPIMRQASAIVTNRGGRTCHAAIIARELGIPAIVGCGDATHKIQDGDQVTISCAEGDTGFVYAGNLRFEEESAQHGDLPKLPVKIMMNIGNPSKAFAFQSLPNEGVGLARLEFIIGQTIGIHPQALLNFNTLEEPLKSEIHALTACYASPTEFYVEKLKEGIATLAAAFYPKPIIVRLSDFKTNEYRHLLGGKLYEPEEENPMIGYRGASRYLCPAFKACFAMECQAFLRAREALGLNNIELMIPFVRTLGEAKGVIDLLAAHGLRRGENGLKIIMMCEVPSNAILAEQFLEYFDGFSIGSNDLTQLTLGLDRDSGLVASLFDERDPAIKVLLEKAIQACKKANKYIGICGQGPSDHPDFAAWLLKQGINSISLNPDTVIDTWLFLAKNNG
jgi:pyruvate, water dikinase